MKCVQGFVGKSVYLVLYSCIAFTGGTNESDHSDSPSMRKCLRKTRGELLLREYEVWVHHAMHFYMFHMLFHMLIHKQVDALEQTYQGVYHPKNVSIGYWVHSSVEFQ